VKDGGRIEMNWFSLVYEDLNDLSDHGQNERTTHEMASRPISVCCQCKQTVLRKCMAIESIVPSKQ
jgi:hypothetical protein